MRDPASETLPRIGEGAHVVVSYQIAPSPKAREPRRSAPPPRICSRPLARRQILLSLFLPIDRPPRILPRTQLPCEPVSLPSVRASFLMVGLPCVNSFRADPCSFFLQTSHARILLTLARQTKIPSTAKKEHAPVAWQLSTTELKTMQHELETTAEQKAGSSASGAVKVGHAPLA